MNGTPYYNLPIYEPTDNADVIDGYNRAMLLIDAELRKLNNRVRLLAEGIDITDNGKAE